MSMYHIEDYGFDQKRCFWNDTVGYSAIYFSVPITATKELRFCIEHLDEELAFIKVWPREELIEIKDDNIKALFGGHYDHTWKGMLTIAVKGEHVKKDYWKIIGHKEKFI